MHFVNQWWQGNANMGSMNKTCIVLIPKCSNPQQMGDFRPISLCIVLYKVISKMMANRLKLFLFELIYVHQSAFVPGRLITDNAMIAFEIFHNMKRKANGKRGLMAFKLDMSKAYDRVEWCFVERVMVKMRFCDGWIQRIMACLSGVSYSFKLNGACGGVYYTVEGTPAGRSVVSVSFSPLCRSFFKSVGQGI